MRSRAMLAALAASLITASASVVPRGPAPLIGWYERQDHIVNGGGNLVDGEFKFKHHTTSGAQNIFFGLETLELSSNPIGREHKDWVAVTAGDRAAFDRADKLWIPRRFPDQRQADREYKGDQTGIQPGKEITLGTDDVDRYVRAMGCDPARTVRLHRIHYGYSRVGEIASSYRGFWAKVFPERPESVMMMIPEAVAGKIRLAETQAPREHSLRYKNYMARHVDYTALPNIRNAMPER